MLSSRQSQAQDTKKAVSYDQLQFPGFEFFQNATEILDREW
jgi:hypothetical protein